MKARAIVLGVLFLVAAGCGLETPEDLGVPRIGTTHAGMIPADVTSADGVGDALPLEDTGVVLVDPPSGSPAGGDIVFVEGWGFTESVKVYFDEYPATEVFYVNSKKLRVVTPAHALGKADVNVWWPSGTTRTLAGGFVYTSPLKIEGVEPNLGPIAGGTPVKVTGAGFTPDAKLVIGRRLAMSIEVVNENTILAITPPGEEGGPVDVLLSSELGTVQAKRAFTFSVAPVLQSVEPAAGRGGDEVVLRGRWLATVTKVLVGNQEAEVVSKANDKVRVRIPEGSGLVPVTVTGTWGWDRLDEGFLYLGPAGSQIGSKVIPASGSAEGGDRVTVVACDGVTSSSGAVDPSVLFGGKQAEVLERDEEQCAVVVRTPSGSGLVDVKVGSEVLAKAFTYLDVIAIESLTPASGDAGGGTKVVLKGKRLPADAQVMIGPFPALNVKVVSDEEIELVTPPGSPGMVDVSIYSSQGQALLRNGYVFTVKKAEIYAVRPNYGSQSGGTQVEILGAGFVPTSPVLFAANQAREIQVASYSRIVARAPVAEVGTVTVQVGTPTGMARLENAYTYFNPMASQGGVWGDSVDGAVNVTVLDAYTWEGLEEASVVLGSDVTTPYKGQTDARGQVTLSSLTLRGPVDVHAYRPGWDAASVIQTDGENVTVYLIPDNPPSTGTTEPGEELLPGSITGRLSGLNKYVVLPPGSCSDVETGGDGLCEACGTDRQCPVGLECLEMEKGRFHCSRSCEAGEPECPEGYTCSPMGSSGSVCAPSQGKREAHCQITTAYMYKSLYDDGVQVIESDGEYLMDSRLGEVAVVCLGGYTDRKTGVFHPLAMGVRRHINVPPGTNVPDQDIQLDIPLNRSLRLRMDSPPSFENYSGEYRVEGYLELGSDGYFPLPDSFAGLSPDDLVLNSMPQALAGELYDARYVFVGGAYTTIGEQSPYSVVYTVDVTELDSAGVALSWDGPFEERVDCPPLEFNGVASRGSEAMLAGAKGRMVRYAEGEFRAEPSVTGDDWEGIEALPDGSWIAVGKRGAVGRKDEGNWHSLGSVTDGDLRDVAGESAGDWVAVGAHRFVLSTGGVITVESISGDLYGVERTAGGAYVMVGAAGTILQYNGGWSRLDAPTQGDLNDVAAFADGSLVVGGVDGVYRRTQAGPWENLAAPAGLEIRRIRGLSGGDFLVAGGSGAVYRYTEVAGWEPVEIPKGLRSTDVATLESGESMVVGTPALLITPFLPFPTFRSPLEGGGMKKLLLDWIYKEDYDYIGVYNISITDKYGASMWRLIMKGTETRVRLPDFDLWLGQSPIRGGEKRVRFYSGYAPYFNISHFDLTDLSTFDWGSFVYDIVHFQ